jgi:CRISPR-associated protein Csm4
MNKYRIKVKVKSALGTPLMGDTIFGHLCWGIKFHEGDSALTSFLEKYNESPQIIISDGFPEGFLPVPLLHPVMPEESITLEMLNVVKKAKKVLYIKSNLFFQEKFAFSEKNIIQRINDEKEEVVATTAYRMHNTINRLTGTTSEIDGGLHSTKEVFTNDKNSVCDIYVLTMLEIDRLKELFVWTFENGYGADKSTGKGSVSLLSVESVHFPESGNRAMAIGSFIPDKKEELINLRADLFTKFGKLGGTFVTSENPFKKPLIMYKSGSTFSSSEHKEFVGTLVGNIHSNPMIKHHAFAPVIYFNEEEG